jgi:D-tyrosyl-tRNA(Tyr) deacylase
MRALVQRVTSASVTVDERRVASIGPGLVVFVGVTHGDTSAEADWLARKVYGLRILRGESSLADSPGAAVLAVSQFTLYGDARKGRRPTWAAAAPAPVAEPLVAAFVSRLRVLGTLVETGVFGAQMSVELANDGPVTLLLDA